jgi:hypothetical protein
MATNIEIELSWATSTAATEYRIYQRNSNTGWVLTATVTAPNTTYIFNGVEGVQYMFAVRVYNGSYESDVATINYPQDVTSIWTTPLNTPTGLPMLTPYDIQYVTKEEFLTSPIAKGLGYTATSTDYLDGTIDHALLKASSIVNRYCRRYFQKMTIDEIYPNVTIQVSNPRMTTVPLRYGPVQAINTITIQVLKWFIPFTLDYLIQQPEQRFYQIVPMISSAGTTGSPIPSVLLEQSNLGIIWTNYTFGYDIIPEDVKHAVEIIAGQQIAMLRQNPMGASSLKTGTFAIAFGNKDSNPVLTEVYKNLDPWKIHSIRMT